MAQVVYGLVQDYGDGTSGMRWYRNEFLVDKILDDDDPDFDDSFYPNEGCPAIVFTFPDGLDLEACGFSFSDEDH